MSRHFANICRTRTAAFPAAPSRSRAAGGTRAAVAWRSDWTDCTTGRAGWTGRRTPGRRWRWAAARSSVCRAQSPRIFAPRRTSASPEPIDRPAAGLSRTAGQKTRSPAATPGPPRRGGSRRGSPPGCGTRRPLGSGPRTRPTGCRPVAAEVRPPSPRPESARRCRPGSGERCLTGEADRHHPISLLPCASPAPPPPGPPGGKPVGARISPSGLTLATRRAGW
jgi:hypothetical protein